MAVESVTEACVARSIQRLANVQGILTMTVKTIDKEVTGSPLWEASEAIHGVIEMVQDCYCALNDNDVTFSVGESGEALPQGPQALAGWDSSIYMGWLRAMSDVLMSGAHTGRMAVETMPEYGGLMHALTEAAEEMQERERSNRREEGTK